MAADAMTLSNLPRSHFAILIACAVLAYPAGAQSPTVRERDEFFSVAIVAGQHGWLTCKGNGDGTSTLAWDRSGVAISAVVSLAFDRPGHACPLGADRFLVTGLQVDATQSPPALVGTRAYVVRLRTSPAASSISLEQTEFFAGVDLCRVILNAAEEVVYAYDRESERLVAAPQSVVLNLVGLAWAPILDAASFAKLRRGRFDGLAEPVTGASLSLLDRGGAEPGDVVSWDVAYVSGTWTALPVTMAVSGPRWGFASHVQNARADSVAVIGDGACALAEVGGADLATSSVPSGQLFSLPVPAGAMTPGGTYFLRNVTGSHADSTPLTFNSVWGTATDGPSVRVARDLVTDLHVRNAQFGVSGRVQWTDDTSTQIANRDVYLLVAAWIPDLEAIKVDPLTQQASMASVIAIVGPLPTVVSAREHGHAFINIPAPTEDLLAGWHITFQWAVADGAGIAWSEVFGSLLFPDPIGAVAATAAPGTSLLDAMPAVADNARTRAALARWVGQTDCLRWNDEKQQLARRLGLRQ